MPNKMILVVDDEQDIQELVRYNLGREDYEVSCVGSGEEAFRRLRTSVPDLILLDLMLPGLDGLEICKLLKADPRTARIPIIMLTAKGEDADIVTGLELGAEDYVTKPFSPRVLLARIKVVMRRTQKVENEDSTIIRVGEIVIDSARHQVTAGDLQIDLTALEMRILQILARRPGLVLTRYQIVQASQGPEIFVNDRSIDVHIVSLRRKLGIYGKMIETVRGVGYRIRE